MSKLQTEVATVMSLDWSCKFVGPFFAISFFSFAKWIIVRALSVFAATTRLSHKIISSCLRIFHLVIFFDLLFGSTTDRDSHSDRKPWRTDAPQVLTWRRMSYSEIPEYFTRGEDNKPSHSIWRFVAPQMGRQNYPLLIAEKGILCKFNKNTLKCWFCQWKRGKGPPRRFGGVNDTKRWSRRHSVHPGYLLGTKVNFPLG